MMMTCIQNIIKVVEYFLFLFLRVKLNGFLFHVKLVYCGYCCTVEDLIEIQAVALLKDSEEWTDDVYSLSASVMDGVCIVYTNFMFTEL